MKEVLSLVVISIAIVLISLLLEYWVVQTLRNRIATRELREPETRNTRDSAERIIIIRLFGYIVPNTTPGKAALFLFLIVCLPLYYFAFPGIINLTSICFTSGST